MQRIIFLTAVICLCAGGALAQTDNLLITEYVEGSGNNMALEIFNGTEDLINLGDYSIDRYSNGSTDPVNIPLTTGDLEPGDTWVIVNPQADSALLELADQTDDNLNFSGDDALVLVFNGTQVVDSFGQVGVDPGDYWSCDEGNTQNHTLRRLSSICTGDTDIYDEFDPCLEYSFFPIDVFTGLGYHMADCGAVATDHTTWGTLKANFR